MIQKILALELQIARDESVLNDWNAGIETEAIAAAHGISAESVYLIAHVNGGNVRHNYLDLVAGDCHGSADRKKKIEQLYSDGMRVTQIAKQLGVSHQRVSRIVREVRGLSKGERLYSARTRSSMEVPQIP